MIGGVDIPILTQAHECALDVGSRAVQHVWPTAVFEDGGTGERFDSFARIPFGQLTEVFAYRDATIANEWDSHGSIPQLENTMVHLIANEDELTVVVDDPDEQAIRRILEGIQSGLALSVFSITPELESAAA